MEVDILDTETASLEGGVCDLAIARVNENFEVVWEVESLIDPERPISPQASGIHHITDDMVWASPTLSEFMDMHQHPLKRDGLVVGGHNVQFDCRMLASVLPQSYAKLCTLRLAKHFYPDNPDHKLQTLRYQFKLDAGTAHRAMGDVIACLNFLRHLSHEFNHSLPELIDLAKRPLSLDSRISFGKHKGMRLGEIPMSWVRWFCEQPTADPDLREAFALRFD